MFYYVHNNNTYQCKMCWNKLLRWFDTTQFSYIPLCSPNTCKGFFNPNVTIFQSNCAEGLHLSVFHFKYFSCNHFRENLSEKIVLGNIIIIIMMSVIRKCRFYRSLFCNFSCADGHWEVILALKSAAPCLEIRCSLQVYVEVEPSDSQLVEKAVKALY